MKIFKMLFSGFVFVFCNTKAQTLRINEFSNGSSGAREWVELLVVPTTPVAGSPKTCFVNSIDVSGWILDDNNGDFSPAGHYTGSGMASGHIRFKNVLPWNRLPMGALIVIYNADDRDPIIPADDPLDINNDCVYIMPSSHSSLEYCTTGTGAPQAIDCVTRLDYADCSTYGDYAVATALRSWTAIGLANNGDCMQIRNAAFSQIHGVVYGDASSASGCATSPPMVGNAVTPYISGTGTNKYFAYNGTDVAGYFTATNWITGTASAATPGAANNSTNQAMIDNEIRKGCICDMTLPFEAPVFINGQRVNKAFTVKRMGNDLLFESSKTIRIDLSIFSVDGRLLRKNSFLLHGINYFSMQHLKPCFVQVFSKTSNGVTDRQVLKFF